MSTKIEDSIINSVNNLYFCRAINHYFITMKRLIISVLMLMAATLIFSQAGEDRPEKETQQDVVKHEENASSIS